MILPNRHDQEPPAYPPLPEEVYVAVFVEHGEPKHSDYLDRRTGEYPLQIRLVFAVHDPDVDEAWLGEKAGAWFDYEMNALKRKSIYHPLLALDPDHEPQGGEDLATYLGKRCRIAVKHVKKGDRTFANVDRVMPYRKQRAAGPADDDGTRQEAVGDASGKQESAFVDDDD